MRARRSGQDEQEDASAADHCVAISIAQLQPRFGVQTGDSPKDEIQKINAAKGRRVNVGQARRVGVDVSRRHKRISNNE